MTFGGGQKVKYTLISITKSISKIFILNFAYAFSQIKEKGAQWLSGRVLDLRPRGRGFEPHWHHCVVVLEQDKFILA